MTNPDQVEQDPPPSTPIELSAVETAIATPELSHDQVSKPINSPNRTLVSTPVPQSSPCTPSIPATVTSPLPNSSSDSSARGRAELPVSPTNPQTNGFAPSDETHISSDSSAASASTPNRKLQPAAPSRAENVPGITLRRHASQRRARSEEPTGRQKWAPLAWRPKSW